MSLVLAGDIGGTKTEVALFETARAAFTEKRCRVYPSREYASLEAILGHFLAEERSTALKKSQRA